MSLDTYAGTTATAPSTIVDFAAPADLNRIYNWRHRHNLQCWLERLYFYKGGKGTPDPYQNNPHYRKFVGEKFAREPVFNAVPMVFTAEDLDAFENASEEGCLSEGEWSDDIPHVSANECHKQDEEFIGKARQAMAEGMTIVTHSWY